MDGRAVPQTVRVEAFRPQAGLVLGGAPEMFGQDEAHAEAREWQAALVDEHGRIGAQVELLFAAPGAHQLGGLRPQGAPPHLAPFAHKPDLRGLRELQVTGPQVEDLLDAGAGVEHRDQQGVIAAAGAGGAIHAGQHGGDLLVLQVRDGPRPGAFEGDPEHPLGLIQMRGLLGGQEAGEGMDGGQPDVAGGRAHLALLLEVLEERHDVLHGEIGDVEGGDRPARGAGEEAEEQDRAVAIAADRVGTHAPDGGQVLTEEGPERRGQGVRWRSLVGMVPLALLIMATLGTILAGVVTPTEAAAMGASGALVLSLAYGRLTLAGVKAAVIATMTTTSMVLFLAVASNIFGAIFARLGSATVITNALTGLPVPPFVTLLIVMALLFLLGWPFEWPAIIFVFIPIFYPVIAAMKYDMVWFGALVAVNLQTAYLSPPVAMSAYYLKQVAPQWSLGTIYRGMADFMVLQLVALALLMVFPEIALWFPRWLFGD